MEVNNSDTIFLIEVMRYEQATSYILREVFGDELHTMKPSEIKQKRRQILSEIKKQRNLIRKQYPAKITVEQMREIARETYEQTYESLGLSKC